MILFTKIIIVASVIVFAGFMLALAEFLIENPEARNPNSWHLEL